MVTLQLKDIQTNWDISKPLDSANIVITYNTEEFIYDVICNLSKSRTELKIKKINKYRVKGNSLNFNEFVLHDRFLHEKIAKIDVSTIRASLLDQFIFCIKNEFEDIDKLSDERQTKTKIVLLEELLLDVKFVISNF